MKLVKIQEVNRRPIDQYIGTFIVAASASVPYESDTGDNPEA